ncbi:MAG: translocation/assembly module TamB domain-containing protein [Pseudomonadota bacterium]
MTARALAKWFAIVSGVLPLIVVLALAFILFTETAAKSVWRVASETAQGLKAAEVSGRLAGPLEIRGLHFSNDSLTVNVEHVLLDWQLEKLLFGELHVGRLYASNAHIHSHDEAASESETDEEFQLPGSLPLPVIIRMADTKVHTLAFQSGESAPLQFDAIRLRGQVSSSEVIIRTLTISGPQLEANAQASVQLWKNYQTDATIGWRYAVQDLANTAGTLTAKGNLDGLRISLAGDADETDYGDYSFALNAQASTQSVRVSEALLSLKNSDTTVSASGDVDLKATAPTMDGRLDWRNLRWPLLADADNPPQLSSPAGGARLQGSLDKYAITLEGDVSTPSVPDGQLSMTADGDQQHLKISQLALQALRGVANGSASIHWVDEFQSQFQLSGKGLDPGELFPQWPGSVTFQLEGQQTGNRVDVPTLKAEGTVREQPINLRATASYDGSVAHIQELRFRSGENHLNASGLIGEQLDFKWDLNSPDLSTMLPEARGALSSTGSLSGALDTALVDATVNASKLRYHGYGAETVDAEFRVDLSANSDSNLSLSAKLLRISNTQIRSLQANGKGRPAAHRLALQANLPEAGLDVRLQGGLEHQRWTGRLTGADIKPERFQAWSLRDDVELILSTAQQSATPACWDAGSASVCVEGSRQDQSSSARVTVQDFSLNYLQPMLSPNLEFIGTLSAKSDFNRVNASQWAGTATIDTSAIRVTANELAGMQGLELLSTEPGKLSAHLGSNGGQASYQLPFVNGGGISGQLSVAESNEGFGGGALSGDLQLHIPELEIVAAFVPELKAVQGKLVADVSLSGTVGKPEPTGELSLSDGSAELSTPGLEISDVQMKASFNRAGTLEYSGSARSDEGSLTLKGRSQLGGEIASTQLTLQGERFQLWNNAEARVWASPDLTISQQGKRVEVAGKVAIPKARVTPQELPVSAVGVSRDQIIIRDTEDDENTANTDEEFEVHAAVELELDDDVSVEGFGFKGAIEGNLAVQQNPSRPLVAKGELNIVNGEYRAYGQGLVIDRGQVLFAGGAIENPGISVRALRRPAENIVVGVNVRGELRQPELNLFSEPGMSQSDQLSWLVLGRPLQNATGAESDYITQAALALGIRGGNQFTKGIGDSLGVDTFGIQTGTGEAGAASDVNQAALVIGKYLTPKLYVSYGVGLLDAVNTVKLRYLMTDRWNLETESSAISSGGDVSYSFEK